MTILTIQIGRSRRNGRHVFCSDHLLDRASDARENNLTMPSNILLIPSSSPSSSNSASCGTSFIEHPVSKMDTLAGVAIKYGVEVADIKRMNGLVTDRQMFALKSLQIPLPGRHPPSTDLSNGSAGPRDSSAYQTPPRRAHNDVLESLQSLRLKSPQRKVSPAMSSLQGYYGLKPPSHSCNEEATDLAVHRIGGAHYLEDGLPPKPSSLSDPPRSRHRKSRSLVNELLPDSDELIKDVPFAEAGNCKPEKSNEKSVRRRLLTETESGPRTPELLLKEENNGSSGFSAITGKGLALRPKSGSRVALAADCDSGWLNPIPLGLGDSLITNGFDGVRKSSSTSNLQEQDNSVSSSIWATPKWTLKPDLQALSAASITRPIFDGLPKPIASWRSKAALD